MLKDDDKAEVTHAKDVGIRYIASEAIRNEVDLIP
jgi:hypothetical protein